MIDIDNQPNLLETLELLSCIEPTGNNFLSCYLDNNVNPAALATAFRQLQTACRQKLSVSLHSDFDHAAKMLDDYLDSASQKAPGLAIFSRGILGGQFFLAMPLPFKPGNRLDFKATPQLERLIELSAQHAISFRRINPQALTSAMQHQLQRDENSYHYVSGQDWPAGPPLVLHETDPRQVSEHLDLVA